eukprot:854481-Amphidinium_carterae.1
MNYSAQPAQDRRAMNAAIGMIALNSYPCCGDHFVLVYVPLVQPVELRVQGLLGTGAQATVYKAFLVPRLIGH